MLSKTVKIGIAALLLAYASAASAAEYEIDPAHSAVTFKVKHLLAYVNGTFDDVQGRFTYVPGKPKEWKITARIKSESINTRSEQRDKHLRSGDFLDTEHYPELTFTSTGVTDYKDHHGKLHGILSLHGVEKEVALDLMEMGVDTDPWGNELAGFSASTVINRKDFGLLWNQAAESGRMIVGDEVHILIDVEGKTVVSLSEEEQKLANAAEQMAEQPVEN